MTVEMASEDFHFIVDPPTDFASAIANYHVSNCNLTQDQIGANFIGDLFLLENCFAFHFIHMKD